MVRVVLGAVTGAVPFQNRTTPTTHDFEESVSPSLTACERLLCQPFRSSAANRGAVSRATTPTTSVVIGTQLPATATLAGLVYDTVDVLVRCRQVDTGVGDIGRLQNPVQEQFVPGMEPGDVLGQIHVLVPVLAR